MLLNNQHPFPEETLLEIAGYLNIPRKDIGGSICEEELCYVKLVVDEGVRICGIKGGGFTD